MGDCVVWDMKTCETSWWEHSYSFFNDLKLIAKIMIFGEEIELKVYVNQHDFVSDIKTPSLSWFHFVMLFSSWIIKWISEIISIHTIPDPSIDILYTLDSASNYSAIQKLKPWLQTQDIPMKWEDSYVFYFLNRELKH
jgi:hypothetical protein